VKDPGGTPGTPGGNEGEAPAMGGGGGPAGGGGCRPVPPVPDISPSSSAPEVSGSFELLTWLAAGELKLWLSATPAAFPAESVAKFADLGTEPKAWVLVQPLTRGILLVGLVPVMPKVPKLWRHHHHY